MSNNAYIVSAVRTAGGKKNGSLSQWHPADLGAKVLDELVHQSGIDPALIDDVIYLDALTKSELNPVMSQEMLFLLQAYQNLFQELQWIDNVVHLNKLFILQFKL